MQVLIKCNLVQPRERQIQANIKTHRLMQRISVIVTSDDIDVPTRIHDWRQESRGVNVYVNYIRAAAYYSQPSCPAALRAR
jgi:hypothetical protein